MKRELAIKHILEICKTYQYYIHWQISARITLASLYHDARISPALRLEISSLIENQKLMDYDYLLSSPLEVR